MQYQQPSAIRSLVDTLPDNVDSAKSLAHEMSCELIVISWNENDLSTLPCLPKKLLDDVVVLLRPMPTSPEGPAVDDVAHEVEIFGIMAAYELQQLGSLRGFGPKMDVRDPDRSVIPVRVHKPPLGNEQSVKLL